VLLPTTRRAVSTAAAINAAHDPKVAASAITSIEQPLLEQLLQGMFVGLTTLTLIKHRAVPVEAVLFQAVEQRIRRSRLLPRRVQILYAYLPFAIGSARVQVAGQSADQRAEMQRAGR